MITKQLQDKLSLLIIRSSMKGKYAVVQTAENNHITMMAAMTLCLLEPDKSVPMKAMAKFVSCDPSNITGIVEQLVHQGLVERREAIHDRRIKTVTITKKGLAMRDRLLDTITHTRMPNINALSPDEVETLIGLLEKATDTSALNSVNQFAAIS